MKEIWREHSENELSSKAKSDSKPIAIYHAFDTRLENISSDTLRRIKEMGFTHIQIPPIQECHDYGPWHAKYQPTGYQIGNTYGTQSDLAQFIRRAHEQNLLVIADIVLNHLATLKWNGRSITAEDWKQAMVSKCHKLGFYESLLAKSYSHIFSDSALEAPFSYFLNWNEPGWVGGALPQLNTTHPNVRNTQIQFLKNLIQLGVDGFRLDAVEHLHPESIQSYRNLILSEKPTSFCYGEIVAIDNQEKNQFFSDLLPITDFVLLKELIDPFRYEGSLQNLRKIKTNGKPDSITFALNHDTYAAYVSQGKYGIDINFPTLEDSLLATQFITARSEGIPLILAQDVEQKSVPAAVQFRAEMKRRKAGKETFVDLISPDAPNIAKTLLILAREEHGLFFLNKSSDPYLFTELVLETSQNLNGYFQDIASKSIFQIISQGRQKTIVRKETSEPIIIPKRDALYLVKIDD